MVELQLYFNILIYKDFARPENKVWSVETQILSVYTQIMYEFGQIMEFDKLSSR